MILTQDLLGKVANTMTDRVVTNSAVDRELKKVKGNTIQLIQVCSTPTGYDS